MSAILVVVKSIPSFESPCFCTSMVLNSVSISAEPALSSLGIVSLLSVTNIRCMIAVLCDTRTECCLKDMKYYQTARGDLLYVAVR